MKMLKELKKTTSFISSMRYFKCCKLGHLKKITKNNESIHLFENKKTNVDNKKNLNK